MKRKTPFVIAAVFSVGLLLAACASDDDESSSATTAAPATTAVASDQTCVEIAASTPDFSTLVTAVTEADLADTLSGEGPFTIFAPTNAAFAALPAGTLDTLLEPANQAQLQGILTYHVVSGEILAADVEPGAVTTVQGTDFTVAVDSGEVTITDGMGGTAKVTDTDITCSNGVIHVIDAVLLPAA